MDIASRWYRDAPATTLFTTAATLVWIITALQSLSIMNNLGDSALADAWLLWGPAVSADGVHWFRALGAIFLHVDLGHLAINGFMLMFIGREIEQFIGTPLYTLAFLAGGIGASATVVWLDYSAPTAGASGAIFALMVLLVGVNRHRGADLRAPLVLIAVNVAYTFLASNVSLWGHFGGLFFGVLLAAVIFHRAPVIRWGGATVILVLACVLVVLR